MIERGMMKYRQQTCPVKLRFPLLVLPAFVLSAPGFPLQAEPLTFAEAIELAETATPAIEARSLVIEAAQSAAIAADQLPDPKLSVDIMDRRIAGPFEFSPRPGRNGFPRQRIGISPILRFPGSISITPSGGSTYWKFCSRASMKCRQRLVRALNRGSPDRLRHSSRNC